MTIVAKIDVTKIDKAKLFKGEKGTYLDVVLVETPNSQYDQDYMVVQSVSKQEREAGVKGAILGNAKILGRNKPASQTTATASSQPKPSQDNLDEDVPF